MNTKQSSTQSTGKSVVANKPLAPSTGARDNTGLYYSTHIKITDPKTGQVLLHTRGE